MKREWSSVFKRQTLNVVHIKLSQFIISHCGGDGCHLLLWLAPVLASTGLRNCICHPPQLSKVSGLARMNVPLLMKRINITKLGENEEDRRTKIIEYITNHQGCNIQEVIRGVENYVSRVTVFNILDSLEKVGAIRRQKDKPNSRDHKLFVDTNNPLISLPKGFEEFKKSYYSLLETVKKDIKVYLSYPQRDKIDLTLLCVLKN